MTKKKKKKKINFIKIKRFWKPAWKLLRSNLKKLNIELLYDPAILLLRHIPKRNKTYSHIKAHRRMFIAAYS